MLITITPTNPDPLYKQIEVQIKNAVVTGQLKPGDALPSIRNLARELRASVITVKRAYSDLENEGFIITRQGLGSFVTDISRDRLRTEKMDDLRARLKQLIIEAKKYGIQKDDIIDLILEMEVEHR